jgi:membrane protein required for colicin V production
MTFDLLCIGVALLFLLLGLFRGLLRQLFGVVGFVGGLLLARFCAEPLGQAIAPSLGLPPVVATVAVSVAIFFSVEVVSKLLGNFLHEQLGAVTGTLDKVGGAAMGLAKGLLVVWVLGSLAGLLHRHAPSAEGRVAVLSKLGLGQSQVARLSLETNVLGDVEEKFDNGAAARLRRAAARTQKQLVKAAGQAGEAAEEKAREAKKTVGK